MPRAESPRGARARGARSRGKRGRTPRGPLEPRRTHPRGASPWASRAGQAAAGDRRTRRKGKTGPSGSLPWDTSCSALGPRRSPRLTGSLPAPPAEVCSGVTSDTPGPRAAPPCSARVPARAPAEVWAPPPGPASPRARAVDARPGGGRWGRGRRPRAEAEDTVRTRVRDARRCLGAPPHCLPVRPPGLWTSGRADPGAGAKGWNRKRKPLHFGIP